MTNLGVEMNEDVSQREILKRGGQLHWAHWIAIVLSIVLTLGAWAISRNQILLKNEEKFHRQADQAIELVEERMHLYENALWGAVAFMDASKGDVGYKEWLDYANSLRIDEVYAGINGIGVIHNILPAQMSDYLKRVREDRPDFALHPSHDEAEYWPITYIEPAGPNAKAVGLDMAFETNRYSSILKARDLGKAQMTGPITLVQDAKRTPGFLLYTPFYKHGGKPKTIAERQANIIGVTYAPFIMSKLMHGTLASHKRLVRIGISDNGEPLYDDIDSSAGETSDRDASPLFSKEVDVEIYGRVWKFNIETGLGFRQEYSSSQPYWILIGGLLIDSLLFCLFVFLTRANRRALAYADHMNEELGNESSRLAKSNEELEQFAYVASHDLKAPLRGIDNLAGFIREDIGEHLDEDIEKNFSLLRNRINRMEKLLDDLLEYSRAGSGKTDIVMVNLKDEVNDAIELATISEGFDVQVSGAAVNLTTAQAPLRQVLLNIIGNAIKHHDRDHGKVSIQISENFKFAIIEVEDDGPGIPVEFQVRVFKMFQTLKPRDEVEGSGMGLAVVKKVVESVGGSVKLSSTDNERGTKFLITWPKNLLGARR